MSERERVQADEAKGPPEERSADRGREAPGRAHDRDRRGRVAGRHRDHAADRLVPASPPRPPADKIDTLYDVLLICSVPIFVLVMTIAIYSVVRFRAKPGDMGDGAADPRQHPARGHLGDDPVHHGHRARDLRLDHARRHRGEAAERAGRERHRASSSPGRFEYPSEKVNDQGARAAGRPPGRLQDPHEGRDPLVLGAAVPAQVRRRAGPHHEDPAHARQAGQLRGGLRRAVRPRALDHAPVRARRAGRRASRRWAREQKQAGGGGGGQRRRRWRRRRAAAPSGEELFTSNGLLGLPHARGGRRDCQGGPGPGQAREAWTPPSSASRSSTRTPT